MFCPNWVYDICVARTAIEFLSADDMPLDKLASKYASALSEKYSPITLDLLQGPAEAMLMFLSEIEAGEMAAELLNDFCYFRLFNEGAGKPRKMKPLFGALEDPVKTQEYTVETAAKAFRAYVFALRSNTVPKAPSGWMLEEETAVTFLPELAQVKLSILDIL